MFERSDGASVAGQRHGSEGSVGAQVDACQTVVSQVQRGEFGVAGEVHRGELAPRCVVHIFQSRHIQCGNVFEICDTGEVGNTVESASGVGAIFTQVAEIDYVGSVGVAGALGFVFG